MRTAPCKNCTLMFIGCHGKCNEYIRYVEERERIRKARLKELDTYDSNMYNKYHKPDLNKYSKSHKKKEDK